MQYFNFIDLKQYLLLCIISSIVLTSCGNESGIEVSKLMCEYREDPINLDMAQPRFSWIMESEQRGQKQTAFQVLVARSKDKLAQDVGDLWNSGKVESSKSIHVSYNGTSLNSNQTAYWKVRVWDKDSTASDFSAPATFSMAILNDNDWHAKWIGKSFNSDPVTEPGYYNTQVQVNAKGDSTSSNPRSLLLRKELNISKKISRATVHVTGLGYYEFLINGKKVGDYVLSPAKTLYIKSILYDTFDVTQLLQKNKNVLGITLGNGWFNPLKKWWSWHMQWYGDKRAFLQMNIEYNDGTSDVVVSDESWKSAPGPVITSCIYDGEIYDAREEIANWSKPGFDDSSWESADVLKSPRGKLMPQAMQAIKRTQILKPKEVTNPKPGIYVYDLGQNFSGWVKLFVKGSRGEKVTLKYAENLRRDGLIDPITNEGAKVTDIYILSGNGEEIYEPRFTYHGFRYVQIEGFPGKPTLKNIEGIVVHSAVEQTGIFETSNESLNQIHQAVLWSQRSNLMGFPTDCPQRDERLGWMGDAHVTAEEAIDNFNMPLFYQKWLNDVKEGADIKTGDLPYIAPRPFYENESDVAWSSGYHLMVWYFYREYGDKEFLAQHYETMKRYVDFLGTIAKDHILPKDRYGDWLSPNRTGWWSPGIHLSVTTGYYYYVSSIVTKAAKILGNTSDEQYYSNLSSEIKDAYNKKFLDQDSKQYENGSQFANSFPLFLRIVPEDDKEAVLNNLVDNIFKHKGHLSTGILGTKYLMEALWKNDKTDIAYLIVSRKDYPGWINMIKDRTTLSENWDPDSRSNNHVMLGSIDSWFYKALAGIDVDESGPGFKKFNIKPFVPPGISFVKASRETIRGKVSSFWKIKDDQFELDISVPVNSSATVYIPSANTEDVTENGIRASKSEGVTFLRQDDKYAVYSVLSGQYNFTSKGINSLRSKPFVENPVIEPAAGFFTSGDDVEINIFTPTDKAEIRYTLDGNIPNKNSHIYEGPFKINKTLTINAIAYKKGYHNSFNVSVFHQFIDTEKNGIKYDLYEGRWRKLPDFSKLTPIKSERVFEFGLDKIKTPKFNFAIHFKGFINITKKGEYTFFTKSNDGSSLKIGNRLVVDNDEEHIVIEKSGKITLASGRYPIKVSYFQSGGNKSFSVSYQGPGISKQPIPATALYLNSK
ncbi:MAG: family 78 glycoside hydrolase catalytic domain [Chlorobi bacterium]|nr:family 78 glycoside hydrolase catalytic domain [Chlorobiota bacterium]